MLPILNDKHCELHKSTNQGYIHEQAKTTIIPGHILLLSPGLNILYFVHSYPDAILCWRTLPTLEVHDLNSLHTTTPRAYKYITTPEDSSIRYSPFRPQAQPKGGQTELRSDGLPGTKTGGPGKPFADGGPFPLFASTTPPPSPVPVMRILFRMNGSKQVLGLALRADPPALCAYATVQKRPAMPAKANTATTRITGLRTNFLLVSVIQHLLSLFSISRIYSLAYY